MISYSYLSLICLCIIITIHRHEIITQEATLKINMVESASAVYGLYLQNIDLLVTICKIMSKCNFYNCIQQPCILMKIATYSMLSNHFDNDNAMLIVFKSHFPKYLK